MLLYFWKKSFANSNILSNYCSIAHVWQDANGGCYFVFIIKLTLRRILMQLLLNVFQNLSVQSSNWRVVSGVKTWKLTSNFPNRKIFWHVKGMNIPSEKMPGYKHGSDRNRVFMTSQRLNIAELATSCILWIACRIK